MKLIKNILLYGFSTLLTFVFVDLFVNFSGSVDRSNLDFSNKIGVDYKPNTSRIIFNEGFSIVQINSLGLRGPEITLQKPDNTFRIALMGDSFIEGLQVMDHHHLRFLLEKQLSKHTNKKIEVLNFGYSGSEFTDMYARYELKAKAFDPNLVLYFVGTNDMKEEPGDPLSPVVRFQKDSLWIDNNFNHSIVQHYMTTKKIKQNSTIFKLISNCMAVKNSKGFWPILLDKLYPNPTIKSSGHQKNPTSQTYKTPELTKLILENMDSDRSILVNRKNKAFPVELNDILAEKNIQHIELKPVLDSLQETGFNPNYWNATKKTGHWNQQAHEAIAEYLYKKLIIKFQK